MNYSRNMALYIALFGIPAVAVVGLVFLLDSTNASAGITVAAFTVVSATIGAAIGRFSDRLPGAEPNRKAPHRHGS